MKTTNRLPPIRRRAEPSKRGYAAIGLSNPKLEVNVGGAIRAAGCYGADLIVISGVRYRRIKSDTQAACRHIPAIHVVDMVDATPIDCVPVGVEIVEGARDLRTYRHPERAFYLFGPEDGSLGLDVLNRCRDVIYIPTRYCMNLASTVNVVLYDRMTKRSGEALAASAEGE